MKEDNIAIRLKILVDKLGINNSQFADNCKIPRPSLSQTLSGRNKKINDQFIRQIHEAYPNLSINWLLFGEGDMWSVISDSQADNIQSSSSNLIPDNSFSGNHAALDSHSDGLNPNFPGVENLSFPPVGQPRAEDAKEKGLISTGFTGESADSKSVDLLLKIADLQSQIERLQKKIKKVVSVTIYYDDSTFETFSPDGRKKDV